MSWRSSCRRQIRSKKCNSYAEGRDQIMPNTVRFHRVLRAKPEKIYRAFLDPDAMAKWLPPNGFTGKVHHMDARVGGTFKMSFTNFSSSRSHSFGGEFLELVPQIDGSNQQLFVVRLGRVARQVIE